jgi:ribosome recycling factor
MLDTAKTLLEKAVQHLESEFGKIQMGRANPALVEDIRVEQYGSLQSLKNCCSVNVLDAQTLSISPWDKTLIHPIAKAITDAGVGLNPQTMGDSVMIKIPPMTEDRRRDMTKIVGKFTEEGKVSVRNIRGDILKSIKKQEIEKLVSEDVSKKMESDLQKLVEDANKKIEELAKKKEVDIMKV